MCARAWAKGLRAIRREVELMTLRIAPLPFLLHDSPEHGRDGASRLTRAILVVVLMCAASAASAELVRVAFAEGLVHGFLALRTTDGTTVADGDLIQYQRGGRVTSRLWFRFKDGSVRDETAVFTQNGTFRLISDHLIQKGPAFSQPLEAWIDRAAGRVRVRYTDDDGKEKNVDEQMTLPDDLSNGLILTLLKNVPPQAPPPALSMVALTPKPRLVKLEIARAANDPFTLNGVTRRATHYVVKIDIGGFAGLVAPLVGKQPPDFDVWILGGEAPAFVKSEGPLHLGGPVWRIELVSPVWPKDTAATSGKGRSSQRRR